MPLSVSLRPEFHFGVPKGNDDQTDNWNSVSFNLEAADAHHSIGG